MQANRVVIHLDRIRSNARALAARTDAPLCAVVKADGYGHGGAEVARALSGTASSFAVSLVEEGARLRHAGIGEDILVLTPALSEEEVLRGAWHRLIFTVGDGADYALLRRVCLREGLCVRCHLKLNTGMNRYGFSPAAFSRFLSGKFSDNVFVEGVYSHFYAPSDPARTRAQFELFGRMSVRAERTFGKLCRHIAATGGILADARYGLDLVRPGIGLYGYLPDDFSLPSLSPAMEVYAQIVCARRAQGGGFGYRVRQGESRIVALRAGYADGFFRAGSAGACCMDATLLCGTGRKYGEVCLLSDADAAARAASTISYEVLAAVGRRAERVYADG